MTVPMKHPIPFLSTCFQSAVLTNIHMLFFFSLFCVKSNKYSAFGSKLSHKNMYLFILGKCKNSLQDSVLKKFVLIKMIFIIKSSQIGLLVQQGLNYQALTYLLQV